jgi:hypothetical protein
MYCSQTNLQTEAGSALVDPCPLSANEDSSPQSSTVVYDEMYYLYEKKQAGLCSSDTILTWNFNSYNQICPWEVVFRIPFHRQVLPATPESFCATLKSVFFPQIYLPSLVYYC